MSEKKDVWIEIKGIQRVDGESDETQLFTQGRFYQKDNCYYIIYEESEATGFAGCRTMLKVDGHRVSLTRSGAAKTNLLIEREKRNVGFYGTSEGDLVIGVDAGQVEVQLGDHGGNLHFSYSLDINSVHVSDNEVFVDVKPLRT